MKRISAALVDQNLARRDLLNDHLQRIGPTVRTFRDTDEFLERLAQGDHFDILMMAVAHHAEWLGVAGLCRAKKLPILLCLDDLQWRALPRNGEFFEANVIRLSSLHEGELEWRIEAMLHQFGFHAKRSDQEREMVWGDYRFVMNGRHLVVHKDREIHLQPLQFDLAITLFGNMGHVVPRGLLMRSLWTGSTQSSRSRALDVCIARVRQCLGLRQENGFSLLSVYGRGYRLIASSAADGVRIEGAANAAIESPWLHR